LVLKFLIRWSILLYGVALDDRVIISANSIGATLALAVLGFKIRDLNS
jgi:hypothetical protein